MSTCRHQHSSSTACQACGLPLVLQQICRNSKWALLWDLFRHSLCSVIIRIKGRNWPSFSRDSSQISAEDKIINVSILLILFLSLTYLPPKVSYVRSMQISLFSISPLLLIWCLSLNQLILKRKRKVYLFALKQNTPACLGRKTGMPCNKQKL